MAAKKFTQKKHTALPPTATLAPAKPSAAVMEAPARAVPVVPPVPAPLIDPVAIASARPGMSVSALAQALGDASAEAACEAAMAAGTAGDRSAVGPLAAAIENVDGYYHSIVRAAAAASLGQLGDAAAVPALVAGIGDPMAEASAEAVRALAAIGDRRAVPALVAAVRNADGYLLPVVRRAAVLALAKLGGPEATAMLQSVAANPHEDPVVRQAAA